MVVGTYEMLELAELHDNASPLRIDCNVLLDIFQGGICPAKEEYHVICLDFVSANICPKMRLPRWQGRKTRRHSIT